MSVIRLDRGDRGVFGQAVAVTRARIEADAAAHGGHVQRFLHVVCRRFLDSDANVEVLMREARIKRNDLHPTFHRVLGTTPWKYIRARRFDVARSVLAQTRVEVWKVGCLVGYPDPRTFSRAFKRMVGRVPTEWARQGKE